MKIRTQLKAGGWTNNHNEGLRVRTTLRAGGWMGNHNEALQVRIALRAGGWSYHNGSPRVRSIIEAGTAHK